VNIYERGRRTQRSLLTPFSLLEFTVPAAAAI